ncbi:MAG: DUF447 family protein [Isosphaeraceae bacterium]|nr:DUF447 family protein [Isosphaeraceae bacterium]
MILEGIVTTIDAEGRLNVAPMGPNVEPSMQRFILRPFQSSTTYRNLKATGEGVLHVTDDVLLFARTAIGHAADAETRPAAVVGGQILVGSCRYFEFRVTDLDDRQERTTIIAETVAEGRFRDFFGFNRAKHAVIEAAILATRTSFLALGDIEADFEKLEPLVDKTGGNAERAAFSLLVAYVAEEARRRGEPFAMMRP